MDSESLNKKNLELIDRLIQQGILRDERIIDALKRLPRHMFVMREYLDLAYEDIALPTLKESTISQPSTVILLLELLRLEENDKVLEIGAGSGWQAALIAHCIGERGRAISLEIDSDVANFARSNLERAGVKNVEVVTRDGSVGYAKEVPYDRILYTASTPDVPSVVLKQLRVGGLLVAPIGDRMVQVLTVIERVAEEKFDRISTSYVQFVPMKGKFGFKENGIT